MENQKIINLLNKDDIDSKHFATKKWYIIMKIMMKIILIME